jgi:hypothetical protein
VTGRDARFLGLSDDDCRECAQLARTITAVIDRGGSTRTDGWSVVKAKRADDFDSTRVVIAGIDASRTVTIDEPGAEPRIVPADKFIIEVTLRDAEDPAWRVLKLEFLS